jgi:hypothetical protein
LGRRWLDQSLEDLKFLAAGRGSQALRQAETPPLQGGRFEDEFGGADMMDAKREVKCFRVFWQVEK